MADYPPEDHYGNIEYKRSLVDKSDNRIACIATQMRMRLHEGHGEAIYVIGVDDDGSIVGVNDDEFTESFNNLTIAADTNTYSMTMLTSKDVPKTKKKVYEILVRENNEQKYIDIKVAVAGNVDSGKCEKKGTKIKLYSGQRKLIGKPFGVEMSLFLKTAHRLLLMNLTLILQFSNHTVLLLNPGMNRLFIHVQ